MTVREEGTCCSTGGKITLSLLAVGEGHEFHTHFHPKSFPVNSLTCWNHHDTDYWGQGRNREAHNLPPPTPLPTYLRQTEPSNLPAHHLCGKHNFCLAFGYESLLRSKYCVCSSRLPRRFRRNPLHMCSKKPSSHNCIMFHLISTFLSFFSFFSLLIYGSPCVSWPVKTNWPHAAAVKVLLFISL